MSSVYQTWAIVRTAMALCCLAPLLRSFAATPAEEYATAIQPILEKHCIECHGPVRHKADLNFASFTNYSQVVAAPAAWRTVFERVQAFEMPPKGTQELDFGSHQKLMAWLRALPRADSADCEELASDRNTSFYRGYVMSRRLNRDEYNDTIFDLLGVDLRLQELLPADGGGGEGFDTSGNALFLSSIHIEKYLAAADRILDSLLVDDPTTLAPELAGARARLLSAEPSGTRAVREAARASLSTFARRAFRRAAPEDELERYLALFDRGWQRSEGFARSMRLPLKAVLVSPNFLFLAEPEPEQGGVQALAAIPLASRLSYFLWSSMPDNELLAAAENGDLADEDAYRNQIRRMLRDPKARRLGDRFALQWLDLGRLGTDVRPDARRYPEFDQALCTAMRQEVTAYFNYLVAEDRSLLELIDSEFTFVNSSLAALYGVQGVTNPDVQFVKLSDRNRGGVVGMAAIHTLTSFPTRTSPVLRGRWILESLLGEKVNPPPPNVPPLDANPAVAERTVREQLEAHRANPECASCHSKMDPLGFGLENFDVLGRWREQDRGRPIDAQGVLPSGERFTGPAQLKSVLMARKEQVMKHLVRKMMGFALGRELNSFDDCAADRAFRTLRDQEYRASVLVEQIALSFPFRHRFYPKQS
jgi:hypothetical protein